LLVYGIIVWLWPGQCRFLQACCHAPQAIISTALLHASIAQGDNAWVFVHEDDIPDTVKHWNTFSEDLLKEAKAAAPKGVEPEAPTTLTAIVMDSKALSPAEVRVWAMVLRFSVQ
jgi:hypothetical protein